MRINKKLAGVAVAALAASGIAVIAAPSANAFSGAATLNCRLYFGDAGTGTSPSVYNDTFSLTVSPAAPAAGATVTATLAGTAGPVGGPAPLPAGSLTVEVAASLSGGSAGSVTLSDPSWPDVAYAGTATPIGPYSATGTFVASGAGATALTVNQVKFNDTGGSNADTYCSGAPAATNHKASPGATTIIENFSVTGPTIAVSSVTGQTVNNYARTGNTINYGLSTFPNGTANVALCAAPGDAIATCTDAGTTTVAGGTGTGTIAVTGATSAGVRYLKAVNGATSATTVVNILGTPAALTLSPASGGAGTVIAVSGSNFNPNGAATLYSCAIGPCIPAGPSANITATGSGTVNASGNFTGSITAATGGTTIQAAQGGGPTAIAAFGTFSFNALECTVPAPADGTTSCNTAQNLSATVTGGVLKQEAAGGSVNLGSVATGITAGSLSGALNAVKVSDTRGGNLGWSLSASSTDFTAGTKTIAKSNLSITSACAIDATAPASAAGVTAPAAAQPFSAAVNLCTKDTAGVNAGGTTGGIYGVTGNFALTVPAFQAAGAYAATVTITLA